MPEPTDRTAASDPEIARAEALIRAIPDYPEPGVVFRDITPLLADARALRAVTAALIEPFAGQFDVVAGLEARGFLFAGTAAMVAGVGLVPIRKAGKLPRPAASVSYDLEYGSASIEMHDDLAPGTRVLLLDDVLATGGTAAAACDLIAQLGSEVVGTAVVLQLDDLGGRARLRDAAIGGRLHTLFHA
ncbi:MAG: adenine phosphoribosyltransferase [Pseudoclavibacter sp.]